ncbi:hypothetical protein PBY51_015668 [Eleginops maclovinus]|uniref:Interleukin n=1 Tax=Eleginops maclovinus TaxID=56733 RepID=A0AAN7XLR3_ELEMC|nr:hypothetical protein PBY51_015668 [Eleginops maclovinus]
MKRHVICETDSKFYAPTNVKTQCITNALGCIKEELDGTAHLECSDTFEYKDMAVNSLDNLIKERSKKGLGLTDAKECACERYEEKPFNEFLDAMKSLLQRIHSEPSS